MCTAHGIRSRSCLASRRQATWTLCVACILPLYGTGTVLTILRHHILHNVHIKPVKTTSFPKLSLPWDTSTIITAFSYIILAAKIIIINNKQTFSERIIYNKSIISCHLLFIIILSMADSGPPGEEAAGGDHDGGGEAQV